MTTINEGFQQFQTSGKSDTIVELYDGDTLKLIKRNSFSGDRDNRRVTTTFIPPGKTYFIKISIRAKQKEELNSFRFDWGFY